MMLGPSSSTTQSLSKLRSSSHKSLPITKLHSMKNLPDSSSQITLFVSEMEEGEDHHGKAPDSHKSKSRTGSMLRFKRPSFSRRQSVSPSNTSGHLSTTPRVPSSSPLTQTDSNTSLSLASRPVASSASFGPDPSTPSTDPVHPPPAGPAAQGGGRAGGGVGRTAG